MKSPYEAWRQRAQHLLAAGVRPEDADWHDALLRDDAVPRDSAGSAAVPRVPATLVDLQGRAFVGQVDAGR